MHSRVPEIVHRKVVKIDAGKLDPGTTYTFFIRNSAKNYSDVTADGLGIYFCH